MKEQKGRLTNAGDFRPDPNYKPEDPEKAKLILQLGCMITDRMKEKITKKMDYSDPEYWALNAVLTKEEARFMLNFKKTRVHYSVKQLAEMNGLSEDAVQKMCDHLVWTGVVEYERDPKTGEKLYDVPIFVPGSAEFMMMQDPLTDEHPELATFFNLMTQAPLEGLTPMVPEGGAGIGMHVIPVEKAIENNNESISIEKISHWLDKYDGKISVGQCTCRKQQRMRGEGTGEIEGEFCVGVGDLAEFCVERHTGRYITKEEALEIFKRAEDHGFVHQITNIDGEDKIVGICNCAPGVCNAIRTSQLYNTPNMSRSAYRAHVDRENCVACGKCVEVCPVGAAKLGQKLCKADGSRVKYPLTELPDNHSWGPEKWNPNYRDDAKINVYDTGTAPCKTACPAHLAVQGYVKLAKEGRYMDALELIKQDNPFPAVCGAICNRRCEDACTRGTIDAPVAIDEIKKFIAAQELHADKRFIPTCEKDDGGMWGPDYKMAIIGGGPAGMTCAYYLRTRGYDVTVFEKENCPGGMLLNGIPNFRLQKDVLEAEIDILKEMGIEFRCGVEVGKDVTIEELRQQGYKAFYLSIGLQGGRSAGVPGEDAEGVESGVSFLKRVALGLSQDGTKDDVKLPGDVVVVGGGNVAVDVARSAARCTDGKVTMLCLEGPDEMPAAKDEVDEAKAEGIEVENGWGPKEIQKDAEGRVIGIVFKKCTRVKDADGRFNPQYDEEQTITLSCDHVLLAIGQSAEWGHLLDGTGVELGRGGTAAHDEVTFQTGEPDIFVGGDIGHGARFAIDAIADGKKGAESMHRFVHPGQSLTLARDLREFKELDKNDIRIESFDTAPRVVTTMVDGVTEDQAKRSFSDLRAALTEEEVQKEAGRCLGCGASVVDYNRCIGCGLCTTRCKFDAIHLTRDLPHASDMRLYEDRIKGVAEHAVKRSMNIMLHKKMPTYQE